MFGTLVDIENDGNVFLLDKSIALAPKLFAVYKDKNMGSRMVRWVVAVEDYKSIYRKLPTEEREKQACENLLDGETGYMRNAKVTSAREEYRKLQYDPLLDQYWAMTDKMNEITKIFRGIKVDAKNLDEVNDMAIKMEKAAESREKLEKRIVASLEKGVQIHGKEEEALSYQEEKLRKKEKSMKT
jgi:predicted acyl esterase